MNKQQEKNSNIIAFESKKKKSHTNVHLPKVAVWKRVAVWHSLLMAVVIAIAGSLILQIVGQLNQAGKIEAQIVEAKKEESISNIISIKKQQDNMKEMMDSVHSIMYILILAAFVLSVVILYNLGILSYLERYREYATMKVIGFKHSEIMAMVLKESFLNLLIGFVIGIPLSKQFLKLYIRVVSMDSMEWVPIITKDHFLIVIFSVIGFSVLVNLIVSMRIRKIDMVEALKSIE